MWILNFSSFFLKIYFEGTALIDVFSLRSIIPEAYDKLSYEGIVQNSRHLPKHRYQALVEKTSNSTISIKYNVSDCKKVNDVTTTSSNISVSIISRGDSEISGDFSLIDDQIGTFHWFLNKEFQSFFFIYLISFFVFFTILVHMPISALRDDFLQFFKYSHLSQSIRAQKDIDTCHFLKWTITWLTGGDKKTLNVTNKRN